MFGDHRPRPVEAALKAWDVLESDVRQGWGLGGQ